MVKEKRKRVINSNTCVSERLGHVSFEAETLYFRLYTFTDDYGNTQSGAGYARDTCFPKNIKIKTHRNNNVTFGQVESWLNELIEVGLIIPYEIDGIEYYHFYRFEDDQELRKDRIKNSSIPRYEPCGQSADKPPTKCGQVVADSQHEEEGEVEVKGEVEINPPVKAAEIEKSEEEEFKQILSESTLKENIDYKCIANGIYKELKRVYKDKISVLEVAAIFKNAETHSKKINPRNYMLKIASNLVYDKENRNKASPGKVEQLPKKESTVDWEKLQRG